MSADWLELPPPPAADGARGRWGALLAVARQGVLPYAPYTAEFLTINRLADSATGSQMHWRREEADGHESWPLRGLRGGAIVVFPSFPALIGIRLGELHPLVFTGAGSQYVASRAFDFPSYTLIEASVISRQRQAATRQRSWSIRRAPLEHP